MANIWRKAILNHQSNQMKEERKSTDQTIQNSRNWDESDENDEKDPEKRDLVVIWRNPRLIREVWTYGVKIGPEGTIAIPISWGVTIVVVRWVVGQERGRVLIALQRGWRSSGSDRARVTELRHGSLRTESQLRRFALLLRSVTVYVTLDQCFTSFLIETRWMQGTANVGS